MSTTSDSLKIVYNYLKRVYKKWVTLNGISNEAIADFCWLHTDSKRLTNLRWNLNSLTFFLSSFYMIFVILGTIFLLSATSFLHTKLWLGGLLLIISLFCFYLALVCLNLVKKEIFNRYGFLDYGINTVIKEAKESIKVELLLELNKYLLKWHSKKNFIKPLFSIIIIKYTIFKCDIAECNQFLTQLKKHLKEDAEIKINQLLISSRVTLNELTLVELEFLTAIFDISATKMGLPFLIETYNSITKRKFNRRFFERLHQVVGWLLKNSYGIFFFLIIIVSIYLFLKNDFTTLRSLFNLV